MPKKKPGAALDASEPADSTAGSLGALLLAGSVGGAEPGEPRERETQAVPFFREAVRLDPRLVRA